MLRRRLLQPAALLLLVALLLPTGFAAAAPLPPGISSSAVYVMNADTGRVLYERNADKRYRMLSITKLMTAFVLVHELRGDLSDRLTVTQSDMAPGSSANLKPGDVWSVQDLLYGMLLVSGNDAANALASYAGNVMLAMEGRSGDGAARFLQAMRQTAVSLGAGHTEFADPHGMSARNVSTAHDLALIGAAAFRDPLLLPYWQCERRSVRIEGPHARTEQLKDIIEIVGEPGIIGAKTGSYYSKGLYNLIVGWRASNGQTIVIVLLGAKTHPARYNDAREIIDALPRDFPELTQPAAFAGPPPPPFRQECSY